MSQIKQDIDAIPGERWFPKETAFEDDMNEYWGDFGVCSEVDTLRAVLMRRPGKEVEDFYEVKTKVVTLENVDTFKDE